MNTKPNNKDVKPNNKDKKPKLPTAKEEIKRIEDEFNKMIKECMLRLDSCDDSIHKLNKIKNKSLWTKVKKCFSPM